MSAAAGAGLDAGVGAGGSVVGSAIVVPVVEVEADVNFAPETVEPGSS